MSANAISMELSVSFVSWINEQLRDEIDDRDLKPAVAAVPRVNVMRSFVVAGVAAIYVLLGTIIVG